MSHKGIFCSLRSDLDRIALDLTGADRIALDIETYGQRKGDGLDPWKGDIRLLTLSRKGGTIWTIDLRAIGYELGPLKPILEDAGIIAHNAKFDLLWLRVKCGLFAKRVHCTLTAARLLVAGTKPGNNLDQCLERYLGIQPATDHSRSDWASMLLTEDQLTYATRDVAHLHDLLGTMESELEASGLDTVWALECALLPCVVGMEATGIHVEREKLRKIADEALKLAQVAADNLRTALGNPSINPASPGQLLTALRAKGLKLESTAEEKLKESDDGLLVPLVLEFREASKRAQQSEALIDHIQQDGRIHGRFEPLGTATGRFSSKEPNLQNIGRGEIREAFTAPEGKRLIVADYSQIELRAAAAIAGETKMIEAYQAGADLHKRTAATVLGKPEDEVTKDDRQLSKACFSGDTEILTPKGWVRLEDYDGTTPVAEFELPEGVEWNPPRPRSNRWGHPTGKVHYQGDGAISFVRPLAFQSFEDRELFHHEDRNTDLLLTPDHQVAFMTSSGNPTKRAAIEITDGNCRHFIAAGTMDRQKPTPCMEAFTRTLAMVVADGYFSNPRCVHFGFSKQRKVERCLNLLAELGLTPRVSVSGRVTTIRITNVEWVENLLSWITIKKDLSWRCVTELPADIYLDEAGFWDSHLIQGSARDRALFSTTSKQTAEVMQAMAATSGTPSVLRHEPRTNEKHSDIWNLSYIHNGPTTWRVSWNLKPTGRRERVWCVQVPSGAILIRRNGKVCVQGNCNFGLIYGQSAPGLVRYAATSYGVTLDEEQATDIRQAFFRTYSRLRQWHGTSHNQAEEGITEVRTRTGRRRLIPATASDWERFTAIVNTPVQGGTADGMKHALVLIHERLPKSARIVSTVHDEVVVECREESAAECREIITTAMVEAMAALFPEVPVEVEANVCTTWAEK
jgi:DNA polymerase I-like protein with 3'-5' exonuclease and polymerase domains